MTKIFPISYVLIAISAHNSAQNNIKLDSGHAKTSLLEGLLDTKEAQTSSGGKVNLPQREGEPPIEVDGTSYRGRGKLLKRIMEAPTEGKGTSYRGRGNLLQGISYLLEGERKPPTEGE